MLRTRNTTLTLKDALLNFVQVALQAALYKEMQSVLAQASVGSDGTHSRTYSREWAQDLSQQGHEWRALDWEAAPGASTAGSAGTGRGSEHDGKSAGPFGIPVAPLARQTVVSRAHAVCNTLAIEHPDSAAYLSDILQLSRHSSNATGTQVPSAAGVLSAGGQGSAKLPRQSALLDSFSTNRIGAVYSDLSANNPRSAAYLADMLQIDRHSTINAMQRTSQGRKSTVSQVQPRAAPPDVCEL